MMPIRVMPIWTVDRNLPGSAARASAAFAPEDPLSAALRRRAVRAETIASSLSANTPLSRINPAMMRRSVQGKGVTIIPA